MQLQAVQGIAARNGILVKIPMDETHVRSLNLATSVGIGLYEV
jgi:tRNA(Leu) C34 or U34 (ribose-2'-O)-methylase TrmL